MLWFRFYVEVLHKAKVQLLSDGAFRFWVNCLCLAKEHGCSGELPDVHHIAWHTRLTAKRVSSYLDELSSDACKLIDHSEGVYTMHNWAEWQYESDVSTERVRRFRQRSRNGNKTASETVTKRSETVSETPSDTEADTEAEQQQNETLDPGAQISQWLVEFTGGRMGDPPPSVILKLANAIGPVPLEHWARFLVQLMDSGKRPSTSWGWFVTVTRDDFHHWRKAHGFTA